MAFYRMSHHSKDIQKKVVEGSETTSLQHIHRATPITQLLILERRRLSYLYLLRSSVIKRRDSSSVAPSHPCASPFSSSSSSSSSSTTVKVLSCRVHCDVGEAPHVSILQRTIETPSSSISSHLIAPSRLIFSVEGYIKELEKNSLYQFIMVRPAIRARKSV